jgi:hypothetical protein
MTKFNQLTTKIIIRISIADQNIKIEYKKGSSVDHFKFIIFDAPRVANKKINQLCIATNYCAESPGKLVVGIFCH